MTVEVTEQAQEILRRSLTFGTVPEGGGIRLRMARSLSGEAVQVELAAGPDQTDEVVELEGLRLFVEASLLAAMPNVLVTVTQEHERIDVQPLTDT